MQNFSFISLFGKKLDGVGKFTYPEWGVARSPRNRVNQQGVYTKIPNPGWGGDTLFFRKFPSFPGWYRYQFWGSVSKIIQRE